MKHGLKQPLKHWFLRFHYDRLPFWMYALLPFAWLYEGAVKSRLWAYRSRWLKPVKVSVPVISVGNLTTGGTGKTPMVIALARLFIDRGQRVVILSRGYGARDPVVYGEPLSPDQGDEAWLITQTLPQATVIVGKDRVKTAQRAIQDYQPDILILDDGYQYLRLARDVDILLIDGHQLIGNGYALPIGPMREPIEEIRRADALWVTKTRRSSTMETVAQWRDRYAKFPNIPVVQVPYDIMGFRRLSDHHMLPVDALREKPVLAFSGIAQPGSFETDLRQAGVFLTGHLRFPDHHVYRANDVHHILAHCHGTSFENVVIVTTEKDRVKMAAMLPESIKPSVYTLIIEPVLTPDGFPDTLKTLLLRCPNDGQTVKTS